MGIEFLAEVARTRTKVVVTHSAIGLEVAVLLLTELGIVAFLTDGSGHEAEAVENDVMIETWITILEGMCRVETRLWIIKGTSVSHTVGIVHVVGCGHVDDLVVLNE